MQHRLRLGCDPPGSAAGARRRSRRPRPPAGASQASFDIKIHLLVLGLKLKDPPLELKKCIAECTKNVDFRHKKSPSRNVRRIGVIPLFYQCSDGGSGKHGLASKKTSPFPKKTLQKMQLTKR